MKIDLQLHSTASDGELCPKEVMRECKKAGLKVVALFPVLSLTATT